MNNSKINDILNDISKSSQYEKKHEENFTTWEEFQEYSKLIVLMIDDLKIIYNFKGTRILNLNAEGVKIIENGGWLEHIKLKELVSKQNSEKERIDFLSKKWIYKNRYLPYILSLLALILSGVTLYSNYNKKSESDAIKNEVEKLKKEVKALKNKIPTKTISHP
jgi:hypothetical protein